MKLITGAAIENMETKPGEKAYKKVIEKLGGGYAIKVPAYSKETGDFIRYGVLFVGSLRSCESEFRNIPDYIER